MHSLRQVVRGTILAALVALAATPVVSQSTPKAPSLVVRDSAEGVKISASGGVLPDARVLRLSNPDRLVLDFDRTELNISTAERERWKAQGVRMAFHAEDGSTRVVFDIPAGQQRWMRREGDGLLVRYTSVAAKGTTAVPAPRVEPPARVARNPVAVPVSQPRSPEAQTANLNREGTEGTRGEGQSVSAAEPDTHLQVISQGGLLQVSAKGVPFKAILDDIATATGASVQAITPMDGQKNEVFEYGPATPMEVIKKLFEGSPYNYLLVSEPNNPTRISRIVVTSTLKVTEGNDGPVFDDDTNPESLSGIAPLTKPKPEEKKPD